MINHEEIRAFLEAQGYVIDSYVADTTRRDWIYITDGQDVTWEAFLDDDEPAYYHYRKALEHFLREELGRHWHGIWCIGLASPDTDMLKIPEKDIETAIRYLEALEA